MFLTFEQVISGLVAYKYYVLFPVSILEGPVIAVLAGFLASLGEINFFIAWGVLVLGDAVGDLFYYSIGRWGRRSILPKYGKYLGVSEQRIIWAEKFFGRHAKKTLLFGKWTHTFGIVILVAAGAVKENLVEFVTMNVIGTIPKALFFLLLGFYSGSIYTKIDTYLNYFALISVAVVIILVLVYRVIHERVKTYFDQK